MRATRAGKLTSMISASLTFAEHAGGLGIKVTEPSQLEAAVDKALKSAKPTIVDIDTDPRRFL